MDVHSLNESDNSGGREANLYLDAYADMPVYRGAARRRSFAHGTEADIEGLQEPCEPESSESDATAISYVVREAAPLFAGFGGDVTVCSPGTDIPKAGEPATDDQRAQPFYHNTNLLVVLDLGVLRATDPNRRDEILKSRIKTARAALANLLHAYSMFGIARVAICAFAGGAALHFRWGQLSAALASLEALQVADVFNDANAIEIAEDAWLADGRLLDGAHNVAYFLSEGNSANSESIGEHLANDEKAQWHDFLHETATFDRVFAIGFNHRPISL